jgi:DNA-binding transcriptional LysR family regulator
VGFLPHRLLDLDRAFPRIRTVLIEATRWDMLSRMRARDADLGIGRIPTDRDGIDASDFLFESLFDERLFVVAGREHPLARRRRVDIRTLSTERWIMPVGGTWAGDLVATEFGRLGLAISEPAIKTDSIPLRSALLHSGRYLTVRPGSMLAYGRAGKELAVLPVDLSGATRTMGIACLQGRTLPPVYDAFLACARTAALRMRRFDPLQVLAGSG